MDIILKLMIGVKSVLAYNDEISTSEKHSKITDMGLCKFTCVRTNKKLNYNWIKNT
jgi:hypothetical protein